VEWGNLKELVGEKAYSAMLQWWESRLKEAEQAAAYNPPLLQANRVRLSERLRVCKQFVEDMKSAKQASENTHKRIAEERDALRTLKIQEIRQIP
jgi:hypothetical protein